MKKRKASKRKKNKNQKKEHIIQAIKPHIVKPVKDVLDSEESLESQVTEKEFQEDIEPLFDEWDAIEVEDDTGEKIVFGMEFNPKDGDLGDETEDLGDLPDNMRKNRYDNTLSAQPTGDMDDTDNDELIQKIHISDKDNVGLGYGDNDYSKEE